MIQSIDMVTLAWVAAAIMAAIWLMQRIAYSRAPKLEAIERHIHHQPLQVREVGDMLVLSRKGIKIYFHEQQDKGVDFETLEIQFKRYRKGIYLRFTASGELRRFEAGDKLMLCENGGSAHPDCAFLARAIHAQVQHSIRAHYSSQIQTARVAVF